MKSKLKISSFNSSDKFHFSRTELRNILEIIQKNKYVIFVWSNEKGWPVKFVSENVKNVFGYTAKEFIDKEILYSDIIYPKDLAELQEQQRRAITDNNQDRQTIKSYRIIDKHGNLHYVEDRTIMVSDSKGKILYLEGVVQDVTKRIKIEDEIIYRYNLEKEVAKISSVIIHTNSKDIQKTLAFAADHISNFLSSDYCCVALRNQNTKKLTIIYEYFANNSNRINLHYHEKAINKFSHLFTDLKVGNVKIIQDINLLSKDAVEERKFFDNCSVNSLILVPIILKKSLIGYLGFYFIRKYSQYSNKDFAVLSLLSGILSNAYSNYLVAIERKNIAEKMRQLNQAVNQSANAIVITDLKGNIEYVNPKFEKITEYSKEEVIGENPRILKSGHTKPEEYIELWNTILNGRIWKGEFKNIAKSGRIFWEKATISPMRNNKNVITHFLAIKEDITEQIRVQNQLALSQKMESIGQLAAGIAHEINTPLQYVGDNMNFLNDSYKAMLDVLFDFNAFLEDGNEYSKDEIREFYQNKKEEMDLEFIYEEVPQAIEQTMSGINRVTKIVRAMKDFAHPGTKKKAYQDLNKGIENTVTISKNEWKYVADVKLNLDKNISAVFCLLDELNQVFLNMIVNAAHSIAEKIGEHPEPELKGEIYIETKKESLPDGDNIIIKFSDTGNGIKKENITKVFDPFFTTKEVGKGTGQGLAIAHDIIINKHNGSIAVESKVGQGTTFTIRLPIDEKVKKAK